MEVNYMDDVIAKLLQRGNYASHNYPDGARRHFLFLKEHDIGDLNLRERDLADCAAFMEAYLCVTGDYGHTVRTRELRPDRTGFQSVTNKGTGEGIYREVYYPVWLSDQGGDAVN